MGVFEQDYDLPGVYTEILPDYSYGYDTSLFGSTDPVLIIGTAFNGPSGEVVAIYSKEHASYVFGKVYDSEKLQESNLVAGIHDAWDRGCRTIYACRVGGVEMYKDFELAVDVPYKLRVAAMFPSNIGKECFIRIENTNGIQKTYIYKPPERATIAQKRQGLVESDSVMLKTEIDVFGDYGLTKDTPLVDYIRLINNHNDNNVIKLGLVDEDGVDVTNYLEVRNIGMGALFSGVYFIGRTRSLCKEYSDVEFKIIQGVNIGGVETTNRPYSKFDGVYFKTLNYNYDVQMPYPIFNPDTGAKIDTFVNVMRLVGITVNSGIDPDTGKRKHMWDWLSVVGETDKAFIPDEDDYEEVNLAGFDLYQRLGMGYAITAKAEKRISGYELNTPRVRETPVDDPNHIVQLVDGIYSLLQDAPMKYRVLTCVTADASTKGKLPKPHDFLYTSPISQSAFNVENTLDGTWDYLINFVPKVKPDDETDYRTYRLQFRNIGGNEQSNISEIYTAKVFPVVSIVTLEDIRNRNGANTSYNDIKAPQGTMLLTKYDPNMTGFSLGEDEYILYRYGYVNEPLIGAEWHNVKIIGVEASLYDPDNQSSVLTVENAFDYYNLYEGTYDSNTRVTTFTKVSADNLATMLQVAGQPANFALGDLSGGVMIYDIRESSHKSYTDSSVTPNVTKESTFVPMGDYKSMVSADINIPSVYAEDLLYQPNDVIVDSSVFADMTFEELVDMLNSHSVFSKLFTAELTDLGVYYKNERLADKLIPKIDGTGLTITSDRLYTSGGTSGTLANDTVLKETTQVLEDITTRSSTTLGYTFVGAGSTLASGSTFSANSTLKSGLVYGVSDLKSTDTNITAAVAVEAGSILKKDTRLAAQSRMGGTTYANDYTIPSDVTLTGSATLEAGSFVKKDSNLLTYETLTSDIVLTQEKTTYLDATVGAQGVYLIQSSKIKAGSYLTANSSLPKGTTVSFDKAIYSSAGNVYEINVTTPETYQNYVSEVWQQCQFNINDDIIKWTKDREQGYDYDLYIPYKTTDNFARQLAQHCTYTELRTAPTWGFIGCRRVGNVDLAGVSTAVDAIASMDFDLYAKNAKGRNMLDRDNMPYPIGRNLNITFMQYETPIETEDYIYVSNGAAGYAGIVSNLPLDTSSTNQPFAVDGISFNLTRYQHARLNNLGIITLKRSFTRGIVVLDGTTMAPSDSVFRRLSASRIVGSVEELIRAVAEPFIGKQNHTANRNSLHTAIKGQLDKLVGTLLEAYQFNLIVDPRIERFNIINIDYELVPIYEIRQIRNRIQVKDALTTVMVS